MARSDAAARTLLTQLGITEAPIVPTLVADRLGMRVITQDMPEDVSGMLMHRGDERVIGVNSRHSAGRQRFTVAHQLGHARLHRTRPLILDTDTRITLPGTIDSMATDREEMEGNRFAVALLAPESLVRHAAREAQARTAQDLVRLIATRFEMTEATMTYRLISLGIITDPTPAPEPVAR